MKLLVLGYARHGKDTVAEMLRDDHGFSFQSSSHFLAEVCVRPYLAEQGITYPDLEACYTDRVNHRAAWHDAICAYNQDDQARLAKEILKVADCYVGMRCPIQYGASKDLFDEILWVDASGRGLPPEPRSSMGIEFNPKQMIFLDNSGSLTDLRKRVSDHVQVMA